MPKHRGMVHDVRMGSERMTSKIKETTVTRQKFVAQYLTPSTASTTATKRSTLQELRAALPDGRVDFHVDKSTAKE